MKYCLGYFPKPFKECVENLEIIKASKFSRLRIVSKSNLATFRK